MRLTTTNNTSNIKTMIAKATERSPDASGFFLKFYGCFL
jgi:hypothetical protein